MKKLTALLLIIFSVFSLLQGCDNENYKTNRPKEKEGLLKKELPKVRIGYLPLTANLHLYIALKEGLFTREGVEVEAIRFRDPNVAMNAVLSRQIDGSSVFGYGLILPPYAKSPGQFKTFLSLEENETHYNARVLVLKDSPINSTNDLIGKKIGTYTGLPMLINAKLLMKTLGLSENVSYVQVKPTLQNDAFLSKQFDALFSIEPYPTIALSRGIARVLIDNPRVKYIANPYPAAAAVFSTEFLRRSPDLAVKVLRAYDAAIDIIRNDEIKARSYLPEFTPVSTEIAQKTLLFHWRKVNEVDKDQIQLVADIFYREGLLKKPISVESLIGSWDDLKQDF
jgi:NitT/TauT family transport system substrate-binding protein